MLRVITETEAKAIMSDDQAEMAPVQVINEAGLVEIKEFLSANHVRGSGFSDSNLRAWADDAEFQLAEGNPAVIEIRAAESVSGNTEVFTVSCSGISWAIND